MLEPRPSEDHSCLCLSHHLTPLSFRERTFLPTDSQPIYVPLDRSHHLQRAGTHSSPHSQIQIPSKTMRAKTTTNGKTRTSSA